MTNQPEKVYRRITRRIKVATIISSLHSLDGVRYNQERGFIANYYVDDKRRKSSTSQLDAGTTPAAWYYTSYAYLEYRCRKSAI